MNRKIKSLLHVSLMTAIVFLLSLHSALAFSAGEVLVKIDIKSSIDELGFPVYAHLQGTTGPDYALVVADQDQLDAAGVNYTLLEMIPRKFKGTAYLIALERIPGARISAANMANVLWDDGRNIILRVDESDAEQINLLGLEIEWLSTTPIVVSAPPQSLMELTTLVNYNANVADMMNAVNQTDIYNYTAGLTGDASVTVGGSPYTITSRHTSSGTPIQKATQYMYEFMQGLGLSASYHDWTYSSYSNRNVIGEKTGTVTPSEIVLVVAHFDSMPYGSLSPGADDNSSGSVGVMMAAELFSTRSFERTVRFVLFTGEEQGLYGSKRYADKVVADGDNIVAVYNMDMIAWDDVGGPDLRLHTRTSSSSGYSGDLALANTFVDVVDTYGLSSNLNPIIDSDGITASDHSPFWNKGFSAILAIEDDANDFCDYYHTTSDQISTLNMAYYTNYVKASVGTAAHLAGVVGGNTLTASFSYTPNLLEVTFTDTSTAPDGETITGWLWNFGDGSNSTLQNPIHTYATADTYTVSLEVTDSASGTDSTSGSVAVTDSLEYCSSSGNNSSYEWVDQVDIGSFSNSSGAAGYSDFTHMTINLTAGQGYATALSPEFSSSTYTEYWKVWVDLNRDGDFTDSGEELFSAVSSSDVSGTITIPAGTGTGTTRMRVTMKWDATPTSCETFSYGEVEDYTVNIQ